MVTISQKAINLIVREEVSSQAYYEKHYIHPEWPGGASGVTVGIGYDLGYATALKIDADWRGRVDGNSLELMKRCAGVRGVDAQALNRQVQAITVSWASAMAVFSQRDMPTWMATTKKALPNCDLLSGTCFGVLVSISYNRGAGGWTSSSAGDPNGRFTEMRAIRALMSQKRFGEIPAQIDAMARLWPNSGVGGRRHREAALYRDGLAEPVSVPSASAPSIPAPADPDPAVIASNRADKAARTPAPATTKAQNTAAGGAIGGGLVAAQQAHQAGMHWSIVLLIIALSLAAGGAVWWFWYKHRNPTPAPASA